MIQIKDLNFRYSSGKSVLENINLEIKEGETLSIIGKNGTGKSSLVRLIAGLTKPSSGEILVDEIDSQDRKKAKEIRKKIGIVFQNPENQILFPKVYDDLEFALKNLDLPNREEKIRGALQKVGMENYSNEDTYELSLGQKQRINIASALAVNPKYLILDEPTTMLDSNGKDKIYEIVRNLKKEGRTIIYVTNYMNEIILADRILVLEDKKIKAIFQKEDIFENMKLLEESQIKIPFILQIIAKLKENGNEIHLQEWTEKEMMQEILKVCEKMKNCLKFVLFVAYLVLIFFVENLVLLVGLFLCNFLAIAIFKISIGKFIHHLKLLMPFALFTALLNIIFGDLKLGILMAVRLLIAYQVTFIFSKSMTNLEMASVIQSLAYPLRIFKINPEKIGLMVSVAFCVIPILKSEIEQKKYALKAKGTNNIFLVIEPIFISILRRTNEMEKALRVKGYEEEF